MRIDLTIMSCVWQHFGVNALAAIEDLVRSRSKVAQISPAIIHVARYGWAEYAARRPVTDPRTGWVVDVPGGFHRVNVSLLGRPPFDGLTWAKEVLARLPRTYDYFFPGTDLYPFPYPF